MSVIISEPFYKKILVDELRTPQEKDMYMYLQHDITFIWMVMLLAFIHRLKNNTILGSGLPKKDS